jgi:prepilin-type N-terminal cleavage/methylation domain-containing protein
MRIRIRRAGFTLVELLVVLAILAVLVGLLLPAIQKVREASSRVRCANNLRQMALACHNFENGNGFFPCSIKDLGPQRSWAVQLLPWIEQGNVARMYDFTKDWCDPANAAAISQQIPLFYCPSSPYGPRVASGVVKIKITDPYGNKITIPRPFANAACTDYAVVHQVKDEAFAAGFADAYGPGMLAEDRFPRVSDITDGLSNTLLINEDAGRPDEWMGNRLFKKNDKPGDAPYTSRDNDFSLRGFTYNPVTRTYSNDLSGPCAVNCSNIEGVYSFHPGGTQAAFGDGAVRFINQRVSTRLFARLVTAGGGEVVNPDDY